jgi:hypothetical protein
VCEELYLSTYRQNRLGYPRIFRPQTHRKQQMKSFTICTSYTITDNGTRMWTGFIWLKKRFNGLLLWTQYCTVGGREYLNQLVKYYPLNKDSTPCGLLYNFFSFINVCFSVTKCDGIISNVQVVTHCIERTGEPLHILQQVINCLATYFVGLLKLQEKD